MCGQGSACIPRAWRGASRKATLKTCDAWEKSHTDEADKRNTFDASRLVNRRLKLNPDEEYTVYETDEEQYGDEDILDYSDLDDPDAFVWPLDILSRSPVAERWLFLLAGLLPQNKNMMEV